MKLLISPAKKMREDGDFLAPRQAPALLERAAVLAEWLRGLDYTALKKLLACNDGIAELNFRRFQEMDLRRPGTPALLSYDGIQYQYMAPGVLEQRQYDYLQDHLRILSGFYGVLRPFDGVTPYRLEMGARLKTEGARDLYAFWGDKLARGQMVRWMAERAVTRAEELQEFRDLGYRFSPERSHPGRYVFLKEDEV